MISDVLVRLLSEASVRAALLLALATAAAWVLQRGSAELRHAMWKASLLAVLLLPLGMLAAPRWELPILPAPETPVAAAPASAPAIALSMVRGWIEPAPAPPLRFGWPAAVALVWLTGCGLLLARDLRCRVRLARLLRMARPATDPRLQAALRSAAARARHDAAFECLISSELRVPLACGVARPTVLMPERAVEWSPEVLSDVLVHELTHLRRRDPLWLWLASIARALYWFHPMVWLATSRLLAEGERACDDAVMREGERPSEYAETLLFVAGAPWREQPATPALAFLRRHGLEHRIAEVLAQGRNLRPLGRWSAGVLAVAALALGGAGAVAYPVATCAGEHAAPTPRPEGAEAWRAGGPARTRSASVCNENHSPAHLGSLTVRITPSADGREAKVSRPRITFENKDRRAITAVQLGLELPTTQDRLWEDVRVAAGSTGFLELPEDKWSAVVPEEDANHLVAQVTGVRFANGETWTGEDKISFGESTHGKKGKHSTERTPAPSARPAGSSAKAIEVGTSFPDGPWVAARFRNPAGAPVEIVEARTPLPAAGEEGRPMTYLPAIRLENHGTRAVVGLRLRYKADAESHAVSGYEVTIPANSSLVLRRRDFDMWGSPEDMTVQILGVRFEDGSIWGTMDSRIDARDAWVYPLEDEMR